MSEDGKPWRVKVQLPPGYEDQSAELFSWLRDWLLPAIVNSPLRITLHLIPPEEGDEEFPFEED